MLPTPKITIPVCVRRNGSEDSPGIAVADSTYSGAGKVLVKALLAFFANGGGEMNEGKGAELIGSKKADHQSLGKPKVTNIQLQLQCTSPLLGYSPGAGKTVYELFCEEEKYIATLKPGGWRFTKIENLFREALEFVTKFLQYKHMKDAIIQGRQVRGLGGSEVASGHQADEIPSDHESILAAIKAGSQKAKKADRKLKELSLEFMKKIFTFMGDDSLGEKLTSPKICHAFFNSILADQPVMEKIEKSLRKFIDSKFDDGTGLTFAQVKLLLDYFKLKELFISSAGMYEQLILFCDYKCFMRDMSINPNDLELFVDQIHKTQQDAVLEALIGTRDVGLEEFVHWDVAPWFSDVGWDSISNAQEFDDKVASVKQAQAEKLASQFSQLSGPWQFCILNNIFGSKLTPAYVIAELLQSVDLFDGPRSEQFLFYSKDIWDPKKFPPAMRRVLLDQGQNKPNVLHDGSKLRDFKGAVRPDSPFVGDSSNPGQAILLKPEEWVKILLDLSCGAEALKEIEDCSKQYVKLISSVEFAGFKSGNVSRDVRELLPFQFDATEGLGKGGGEGHRFSMRETKDRIDAFIARFCTFNELMRSDDQRKDDDDPDAMFRFLALGKSELEPQPPYHDGELEGKIYVTMADELDGRVQQQLSRYSPRVTQGLRVLARPGSPLAKSVEEQGKKDSRELAKVLSLKDFHEARLVYSDLDREDAVAKSWLLAVAEIKRRPVSAPTIPKGGGGFTSLTSLASGLKKSGSPLYKPRSTQCHSPFEESSSTVITVGGCRK